MDANLDKENIKVSSRIPLPVSPLPALPSHLLKKVIDRPPLNTLAGPNDKNLPTSSQKTQSLAGPSTTKAKNKIIGNRPKSPFKIDTRFVTFERGCGKSGFEYVDVASVGTKIGKRRKSVPSVISISSDDERDSRELESYFSDKELPHRKVASTPAFQKLQPARVKNLKRSLKRPHSRELLGVSPGPNRERDEGDRVRRRLNFSQSVQERMQSPDFFQKSYMDIMDRQYTADILTHLISVETKLAAPPGVKNEIRACVINWLMKINGLDGNPATIQMAIWYLDSILSTGHVTLENMQLVAAASYWIATKIQGPVTPASKLVKYANNAFTAQRLLEAEKIILVRLKFPQPTVVAQDYLCYFAWWCNKERPGELEVAATFLCLCGMMVNKNLCQEYPSVVAAASIKNALLLLRKKELMPRLQKCLTFTVAAKKATNISHICSILRHAVRTVAAKDYSYKFIYEQYGTPPRYIAQTIVTAANELAVLDTRTTQAF